MIAVLRDPYRAVIVAACRHTLNGAGLAVERRQAPATPGTTPRLEHRAKKWVRFFAKTMRQQITRAGDARQIKRSLL
jgi:hypothetical protein